jgi:hypothetical protein
MRLYHFSDDPGIGFFTPRPVRVPSQRIPGHEWLNGPLVWAIDEFHQPMYLFPRDCPRILVWPTAKTTAEDRERWWAGRNCRMIAHIEWAWLDRLRSEPLHRYELPAASFEDLKDAGMWISRSAVTPGRVETLTDLAAELCAQQVELRVMESLVPLRDVWKTSLHASGIRLRHAQGWESATKAEKPAK